MLDNKWYAQYCNLCAANVLDKNGELRFTYETLHHALDGVNNDHYGYVAESIVELQRNIINACNKQFAANVLMDTNEGEMLLLTLLNIHAAYFMISGLWKEEPKEDKDEYGFEIF